MHATRVTLVTVSPVLTLTSVPRRLVMPMHHAQICQVLYLRLFKNIIYLRKLIFTYLSQFLLFIYPQEASSVHATQDTLVLDLSVLISTSVSYRHAIRMLPVLMMTAHLLARVIRAILVMVSFVLILTNVSRHLAAHMLRAQMSQEATAVHVTVGSLVTVTYVRILTSVLLHHAMFMPRVQIRQVFLFTV